MKYLPRCLRMHLAGRPTALRDQQDARLPVPDDHKVHICSICAVHSVNHAYLYYICTISTTCVQVTFFETMFFHRPNSKKTVWLRASKSFRGGERRHYVLVDPAGAQPEPYVALLVCYLACLFTVYSLQVPFFKMMFLTCVFEEKTEKYAFIRWFEKFGRPVQTTGGCRLVKGQSMKNIFTKTGGTVIDICQICRRYVI